ncbi:hypothetical protein J2T60_002360 [Natronospira proteinivora]|uniref:Lipoprotein n=1 Tax=Natronospira proteinivora TaxID=1807133 RepID=A0ABT1GAK6_9GAMM|nr:DUF6491 family protein [Natronospira proteinivora]MCP1728360.1 hypothetical protein [Natronospira proteinivora]
MIHAPRFHHTLMVVVVLLPFVVMACAGSPASERRAERESIAEIYERHATGSRDQTVYPAVDRWFSLDEKLVVRTRDDKYFLVEVSPVCANELHFASVPRISLDQQSRNRLTRQDRIIMGEQSCRITGIWRVDHEAARAELDEEGIEHAFLRIRER